MSVKDITDGQPDGHTFGQSITDEISFYGATPVAQQSGAAQDAVGTTSAIKTTGSTWGFATGTQADAIVTLVNEMRQSLIDLGLISGAA